MKIMISEQFQDFMETLGLDINKSLEQAGIGKVVWKENIDLTDTEYWRLMNEMDNELSDEAIIQFGRIENINSFMPSFFAALAANNGQQAIERLAKYKNLVAPCKLTIIKLNDQTEIKIHSEGMNLELPRFTVLTEQLLLVSLLRVGTGLKINPIAVGSKYEYGNIVENELSIKAKTATTNFICFKNTDLNKKFISTNNTMWDFIKPELDRRKLEIKKDQSLEDNVQSLILRKIPSGQFDIDTISKTMNIGKRTLQRNLKQMNTSYNEQVKLARQSLVGPLMKDETLGLIDISYLLGYADPESFSRAFKEWYQQSPSDYRRKLVK